MKKNVISIMMSLLFFCAPAHSQESGGVRVLLQTTYGDIHIRLFDDTPGHRDNFVRNVRDGMYDGVSFHRVIRDFMIQTGNPDTRPDIREKVEPSDTTQLGPSIPAEIRYPEHFHVRGMVAAAREGDDVNPQKRSSQYQFYIVTGRHITEQKLDAIDKEKTAVRVEQRYRQLLIDNKRQIDQLRQQRKMAALQNFLDSLYEKAGEEVLEEDGLFFPENVVRAYRYNGGAPWLDGDYTVFGEVTDGMKVVGRIEKAKTDKEDAPLEEIRILRAVIE